MTWANNNVNTDQRDNDNQDCPLQEVFLFHRKQILRAIMSAGYFFSSSPSMPAMADRAISRIDLSPLLIRKLVSRTVVMVPITPPVVTTRSPAFSSEMVCCNSRCLFC